MVRRQVVCANQPAVVFVRFKALTSTHVHDLDGYCNHRRVESGNDSVNQSNHIRELELKSELLELIADIQQYSSSKHATWPVDLGGALERAERGQEPWSLRHSARQTGEV